MKSLRKVAVSLVIVTTLIVGFSTAASANLGSQIRYGSINCGGNKVQSWIRGNGTEHYHYLRNPGGSYTLGVRTGNGNVFQSNRASNYTGATDADLRYNGYIKVVNHVAPGNGTYTSCY